MMKMKKVNNYSHLFKDIIKFEHYENLDTFYEGLNSDVLKFVKENMDLSKYIDSGDYIGGKIIGNVEPHTDFSDAVVAFFFDESKVSLYFQVGNESHRVFNGDAYTFDAKKHHCVVNTSNNSKVQPFWYITLGGGDY